jgi:hypothetical protein
MADLSKLKKRGTLGAPPGEDEASPNLAAPEVAPPTPAPEPAKARRDGRSARRTNRTLPFATRVSQQFDDRIRDIAERDGLLLVELLERAIEAYERERAKG